MSLRTPSVPFPWSELLRWEPDGRLDGASTRQRIWQLSKNRFRPLWRVMFVFFGTLTVGGVPSPVVTGQPWWYGFIVSLTGLAGLTVELGLLGIKSWWLRRAEEASSG